MTLEQGGSFTEQISLEDGSGVFLQEIYSSSYATKNGYYLTTETETHGGAMTLENSVEGADASYIILESYVIGTIDENAQNDIFEFEDDNVLDFTESNPFGDAGMK
jgi:hypothetical protein